MIEAPNLLDSPPIIELGSNYQVKKVIVAGDRGPCGGVNMAIDTTFEVLGIVAGREPVYANNPPVHNDLITVEFAKQGLVIEPDLQKIPDGSILIASAHGWPSQDKNLAIKKRLLVVDATCQLVAKVERAAQKAVASGKHVIYVGIENHPEPRGILGSLPKGSFTFIDIRKIAPKLSGEIAIYGENGPEQIRIDLAELTILNQTTLSILGVQAKIQELREENPQFSIPDPEGICYATKNRQDQVRERLFSITEIPMDALIVVGSRISHNSKELKEIGEKEARIPSYLVDTPEQIPFHEFTPEIRRVLVTSGASVLDPYLKEVVDVLISKGARLSFLPSREKKMLIDEVSGRSLINPETGEVLYDERFFTGPDLNPLRRRYESTSTVN